MNICNGCGAINETCCKTASDRLQTANSLSMMVDRQRRAIGDLTAQLGIMLSRAKVDAGAYRRDDDIRAELLAACRAQHEAIDRLFAMLIEVTRKLGSEDCDGRGFLPSKSGQPWDAMVLGNKAIEHATARSAGFCAPPATPSDAVHCHTPLLSPPVDFTHDNVLGCNGCDALYKPLNKHGYCAQCAAESSAGGD